MSESSETSTRQQRVLENITKYIEIKHSDDPEQADVDEKYRDAINACIDTLQYATEGNLWNTGNLEVDLPTNGEVFPYGTHVTVIPAPNSNDRRWELITILTTEMKSPKFGGMLKAMGTTLENGNTQVEKIDFSGTEMDQDHALIALEGLALNSLHQKDRLS